MKLVIRKAKKEDAGAILSLIGKLAAYEKKDPVDVKIDLNKIEKHAFGPRSQFKVLLAEYEQQPIAYALYFLAYAGSAGAPILYLEDLFVDVSYRGHGIGRALLVKLAKLAIDKDCCRMEWHAFTWNKRAIEFYKSLGSEIKSDLVQIRLSGNDLKKLSTEGENTEHNCHINE